MGILAAFKSGVKTLKVAATKILTGEEHRTGRWRLRTVVRSERRGMVVFEAVWKSHDHVVYSTKRKKVSMALKELRRLVPSKRVMSRFRIQTWMKTSRVMCMFTSLN